MQVRKPTKKVTYLKAGDQRQELNFQSHSFTEDINAAVNKYKYKEKPPERADLKGRMKKNLSSLKEKLL